MTNSRFFRYAFYHLPSLDESWARFATAWLGWNVWSGTRVKPLDDLGFSVAHIARITSRASRYGLHATIKAPFRLREGASLQDLQALAASFAKRQAPVSLKGLQLAELAGCLALTPVGDIEGLHDLAEACVASLDELRAPSSGVELQSRRASGLTEEEESMLLRWGYPYVGCCFRYHITLTDSLSCTDRDSIRRLLEKKLVPCLPPQILIGELALLGEGQDGYFRLVHRYPLEGSGRFKRGSI